MKVDVSPEYKKLLTRFQVESTAPKSSRIDPQVGIREV